ncbi:hypothetical protein NLU13_7210 [Sarocladium strictum]|uniref:Uncharacterized protein n=1 Tax=Sarocladium strictum TaxID=5046 RepID=A0AA39GER7_SARSR|nr:hypothetical protein NLU13_7210 [Sarocladium strictum]
MAPETRARGAARGAAPPSSRVYNSTPSLQQAQFPARRKTVRLPRNQNHDENEDEDGTTVSSSAALKLKQETLTQIGFVHSSFEERYEGLEECGDSEMEEMQEDPAKENRRSKKKSKNKKNKKLEGEKAKEDEEPPVSTRRRKRKSDTKVAGDKRRRTLGDGEVNRLKEEGQDDEEEDDDVVDRKSRRKTLGDMPSSRYHTQTLTQFMGRDHHHPLLVLDSDDDEPDSLPNDGFDAWLNNNPDDQPIPPSSSSSSPKKQEQSHTRQSSIVPQTPTRPIRTEVPSSSQQVTPLSGLMLERYGAPNAMQMSPSSAVASRRTKKADEQGVNVNVNAGPTPVTGTPLRRKLVVEDSYASEEVFFTPSKGMMAERPFAGEVDPLGDEVVEVASSSHGGTTPTPMRTSGSQSARKGSSSVKRVRISSASPLKSSPKKAAVADGRYEIPDSEEEDIDYEEEEEQVPEVDERQETFTAGDETQFVMDQMAVQEASAIEMTISSSPPLTRTTPRPQPANKTNTKSPLPKLPSPPPPKLLRKPLPPPPLASTQPFESQRLPTSLVQSFPPAAHRTDAILSLPPANITQLTSGYKTSVTLPSRAIHTVVRFWFWDGTEIKYGASLGEEMHHPKGGGGGGGGEWEYPLAQMYELNNPLDEAELALEGIFCRKITTTCGYMPPSIASGMLWNIARALFPENSLDLLNDLAAAEEGETQDDDTAPTKTAAPPSRTQGSTASGSPSPAMTVSQEVAAQLASDVAHSTQFQSDQILVPSTPEDHKPTTPRPRPHHPSQKNERQTTTTTTTTTIRPSQATTASQCSTPSPTKPSHPQPSHDDTPLRPPAFPRTNSSNEQTTNNNNNNERTNDDEDNVDDNNMEGTNTLTIPSSSSLIFQEYSAPSPIAPHLLVPLGSSSQLLSKSQMLSDSLLREDDDDDDNEDQM